MTVLVWQQFQESDFRNRLRDLKKSYPAGNNVVKIFLGLSQVIRFFASSWILAGQVRPEPVGVRRGVWHTK